MTSTPETVDDLIAQLSADADPARESIASELGGARPSSLATVRRKP